MVKKLLLGCSGLVLLLLAGMAVVIALRWDGSALDSMKGTKSEMQSLRQHLAKEFSGQPEVEFVCRFPVVGIAPCIIDSDMDSREVTLTFMNHEPPQGVALEEQARQIALTAFNASTFVKEADKTDVIFAEVSASASVTQRFSFSGNELAAGQ